MAPGNLCPSVVINLYQVFFLSTGEQDKRDNIRGRKLIYLQSLTTIICIQMDVVVSIQSIYTLTEIFLEYITPHHSNDFIILCAL